MEGRLIPGDSKKEKWRVDRLMDSRPVAACGDVTGDERDVRPFNSTAKSAELFGLIFTYFLNNSNISKLITIDIVNFDD